MPKSMLKHHHSLPWTQTTHFMNMIGYQQATGTLPHSVKLFTTDILDQQNLYLEHCFHINCYVIMENNTSMWKRGRCTYFTTSVKGMSSKNYIKICVGSSKMISSQY